jgi:membrane associated rhomboid family serine protease
MSPRSRWLDRRYHVLGGSLPAPIALLIGTTLFVSILGAQLQGFAAAGALVPGFVFQGQLWRLVSWCFFESDPIGLIFGALALFWFGSDLVRLWGPFGFLARYLALAAAAGLVSCLAALVWPPLLGLQFVGAWPVVDAVIIAWAVAFPTRNLLFWFVVPLQGRNLIYATIGGTLLFALLSGGILRFLPHFAAEFISLAAMQRSPFRGLWARVKFEVAYRRWRTRTSRLREVPRPGDRDEGPRWYH